MPEYIRIRIIRRSTKKLNELKSYQEQLVNLEKHILPEYQDEHANKIMKTQFWMDYHQARIRMHAAYLNLQRTL